VDPMSLVVGALIVGASQGVAETAVGEAYRRLRKLVDARSANRSDAEEALALLDTDPRRSVQPLMEALASSGVECDRDALTLAEQIIASRAHDGGHRIYGLDLTDARGVQIGDGNRQNNSFG
jgi:hypothetical protein